MATTQIVPQYSFPHEEVYILDNSARDLSEVEDTTNIRYYITPFVGPKGPDNKLIKIRNVASYRKTFGSTDFKKYGQPHLMPEALLNQANVNVWAMRLMPEDATYANNVLSLWYKADTDAKTFRIKFTSKAVTMSSGSEDIDMSEILPDRDALNEYGSIPDGPTTEGVYVKDGYTQVPLACFTAIGRGVYGNKYRWRITPATDYEKSYGIKVFNFSVIDTDSSSIVSSTIGSMTVSSNISGTVFFNDLMEDANVENLGGKIYVYEDNFLKLYDAYVAFLEKMNEKYPGDAVEIPRTDTFDPLFGTQVKKDGTRVTKRQPYITFLAPYDSEAASKEGYVADNFAKEGEELTQLDNIAGNDFGGGSDGAQLEAAEKSDDPEAARQAIYDSLYQAAFSGKIDKAILSPNRIKCTAFFDANFSIPVKMSLVRLALVRAHALVYLDTGIRSSLGSTDVDSMVTDYRQLDELVDEFQNFSENWIVSVNAQHYYIKESSTGRRIPVTTTYYLASTDATYRDGSNGTVARTGVNARLSGHIKNSLAPVIDESDADLKQALNDARINFFETIADNVFERVTQSCYVHSASDLLEETNAQAIIDWVTILEAECRAHRYEQTTAAGRQEFKEYLMDKYSYMAETVFTSMDIEYTANAYEQARNIVHLITQVQLPTLQKVTLIEVDVNQREYETDAEDDEEEE